MKKRKSAAAKKRRTTSKVSHPGMMGDGTEEQNLGQKGDPAARITKREVDAAFGKKEEAEKIIPPRLAQFPEVAAGFPEKMRPNL